MHIITNLTHNYALREKKDPLYLSHNFVTDQKINDKANNYSLQMILKEHLHTTLTHATISPCF